MSKLAEIETAVEGLSAEERFELLKFVLRQLRARGPELPKPRKFSREQIDAWVKRDEAEMKALREGK